MGGEEHHTSSAHVTPQQRGISSFVLKIAAIFGMTMNHAAYIFGDTLPFWARCVLFAGGGLTFPIMAFLLVEGYRHTSNIERYASRLGIFALVSQIPYGLFLAANLNVLFTLLMGLGVLWLDDHARNRALFWTGLAAGAVLSLACDWGFIGIIMIYLFKNLRGERSAIAAPVGLAIFATGLPQLAELAAKAPTGDWSALPFALYPLIGCSLAIPLLSSYNGQRGRPMKWFFYAYYPAHIAVLGILNLALSGNLPPLG